MASVTFQTFASVKAITQTLASVNGTSRAFAPPPALRPAFAPFAPFARSGLPILTIKTNQLASIPNPSAGKRKLADVLEEDIENADALPTKRSRCGVIAAKRLSARTTVSPAVTSMSALPAGAAGSFTGATSSLRPRKLSSAPAGRSPRGRKLAGMFNSRRACRTDGARLGLSPATTLETSVRGTVPACAPCSSSAAAAASTRSALAARSKSSEFNIHEDTPEEALAIDLGDSTSRLDISSEEDREARRRQELAEGKENIPPPGATPEPSVRRVAAVCLGGPGYQKPRVPLGELDVGDFYGEV